MNPEHIPYAAKVNAAYHLIRNARKIARRLADTTSEQQAIENEIAVIGMDLYRGAEHCPQPDVTHDPGEDHEREAYIADVRMLVPDASQKFIETCREYGFTPGAAAAHYRNW